MTSKPRIGPVLRVALMVSAVLGPLARPHLKRRLAKGKEDPDRWREKLGETNAARPVGPLVWMHGVGVGEVMALRGLIERMLIEKPELNFLVTSSARSSGDVFSKNLPPRTQHQYLPIDMKRPVTRFLDHWKPDLAVWSDQEIWPRLAVTCARRNIPQALVAARITKKSAKAKSRFGDAYGDLYRLLDLRHAQDEHTAATLRLLMDDNTPVQVSGSLKVAAPPLVDAPNARALLPKNTALWVAASAHRADIDVALDAQALCPDHLLIIAPRLLDDVTYIEQECRKRRLNFIKRSAADQSDNACDVFIADSFGELGAWYRAASCALIGGTFDDTQGHNPWEAVALDCAVLHGPNVGNFAADFDLLDTANAARAVQSADDIASALRSTDLQPMAKRAAAVRAQATAGLDSITGDLLALLDA